MKNLGLSLLAILIVVSATTLFSCNAKPSNAEVTEVLSPPMEKRYPDTIIGTLYPKVKVKNIGENEIGNMDIMYKIEICSEHYVADKTTAWQGNLAPNEETIVDLDTIRIHNSCLCFFQVRVMKVNGYDVKSKIQSSFFTNIRID